MLFLISPCRYMPTPGSACIADLFARLVVNCLSAEREARFRQLVPSSFHWQHTHTHTRLTALLPGLPGWAGTKKVKPISILLKQQTVSGGSTSWAIRKSAPHSRQITTLASHHSIFYRPDALPATQPTASKHWQHARKWDQPWALPSRETIRKKLQR